MGEPKIEANPLRQRIKTKTLGIVHGEESVTRG